MHATTLLDTNILLYAISTATDEADKKQVARGLLAGKDWGLSVQVLQEFYVNTTRPPRPAMQHQDAVAAIGQFLLRPIVATDSRLLLEALRIKARYQLSYWDAAIIGAARMLGATTLYTEDLSDGQDYGGVKAVNPFAAANKPA